MIKMDYFILWTLIALQSEICAVPISTFTFESPFQGTDPRRNHNHYEGGTTQLPQLTMVTRDYENRPTWDIINRRNCHRLYHLPPAPQLNYHLVSFPPDEIENVHRPLITVDSRRYSNNFQGSLPLTKISPDDPNRRVAEEYLFKHLFREKIKPNQPNLQTASSKFPHVNHDLPHTTVLNPTGHEFSHEYYNSFLKPYISSELFTSTVPSPFAFNFHINSYQTTTEASTIDDDVSDYLSEDVYNINESSDEVENIPEKSFFNIQDLFPLSQYSTINYNDISENNLITSSNSVQRIYDIVNIYSNSLTDKTLLEKIDSDTNVHLNNQDSTSPETTISNEFDANQEISTISQFADSLDIRVLKDDVKLMLEQNSSDAKLRDNEMNKMSSTESYYYSSDSQVKSDLIKLLSTPNSYSSTQIFTTSPNYGGQTIQEALDNNNILESEVNGAIEITKITSTEPDYESSDSHVKSDLIKLLSTQKRHNSTQIFTISPNNGDQTTEKDWNNNDILETVKDIDHQVTAKDKIDTFTFYDNYSSYQKDSVSTTTSEDQNYYDNLLINSQSDNYKEELYQATNTTRKGEDNFDVTTLNVLYDVDITIENGTVVRNLINNTIYKISQVDDNNKTTAVNSYDYESIFYRSFLNNITNNSQINSMKLTDKINYDSDYGIFKDKKIADYTNLITTISYSPTYSQDELIYIDLATITPLDHIISKHNLIKNHNWSESDVIKSNHNGPNEENYTGNLSTSFPNNTEIGESIIIEKNYLYLNEDDRFSTVIPENETSSVFTTSTVTEQYVNKLETEYDDLLLSQYRYLKNTNSGNTSITENANSTAKLDNTTDFGNLIIVQVNPSSVINDEFMTDDPHQILKLQQGEQIVVPQIVSRSKEINTGITPNSENIDDLNKTEELSYETTTNYPEQESFTWLQNSLPSIIVDKINENSQDVVINTNVYNSKPANNSHNITDNLSTTKIYHTSQYTQLYPTTLGTIEYFDLNEKKIYANKPYNEFPPNNVLVYRNNLNTNGRVLLDDDISEFNKVILPKNNVLTNDEYLINYNNMTDLNHDMKLKENINSSAEDDNIIDDNNFVLHSEDIPKSTVLDTVTEVSLLNVDNYSDQISEHLFNDNSGDSTTLIDVINGSSTKPYVEVKGDLSERSFLKNKISDEINYAVIRETDVESYPVKESERIGKQINSNHNNFKFQTFGATIAPKIDQRPRRSDITIFEDEADYFRILENELDSS